jgi:Peptidase MA superfamily
MGPMRRSRSIAAGSLLGLLVLLFVAIAAPPRTLAFSGFGASSAESEFGKQITFTVALPGGAPEQLDLLIQVGDDPDSTLVAPVEPRGDRATYVWNAADNFLTPNTPLTYRWRATQAGQVSLSGPARLRYADNRPGLDWHSATIGQANVHWYGAGETEARHLGDLTSGAAARAEELLGHALDGPIDIFLYQTRDEFFGALGPGAREWTGAATFPNIRTVFMWHGAGDSAYRDTALAHEVTHVVFYDATNNPYHAPPSWLNEGFARWSEQQSADREADIVRGEASAGLFSFQAITAQFPIGARGSSLSYAQGATMVDHIIATYGRGSIARIAAAYRDGATDAEALKAGTGISADRLYADYFQSFGATEPKPVAAASIGPSIVHAGSGAGASGGASATPEQATPSDSGGPPWLLVGALVVLVIAAAGGAWLVMRQRVTTHE